MWIVSVQALIYKWLHAKGGKEVAMNRTLKDEPREGKKSNPLATQHDTGHPREDASMPVRKKKLDGTSKSEKKLKKRKLATQQDAGTDGSSSLEGTLEKPKVADGDDGYEGEGEPVQEVEEPEEEVEEEMEVVTEEETQEVFDIGNVIRLSVAINEHMSIRMVIENLNREQALVRAFLKFVKQQILSGDFNKETAWKASKNMYDQFNKDHADRAITSKLWARISVLFIIMGQQSFEKFLKIMIDRQRMEHFNSGIGDVKQLAGHECYNDDDTLQNTWYTGMWYLSDMNIDFLRANEGNLITILNKAGIGNIVDAGGGKVEQSDSNSDNPAPDESDPEDAGKEEIDGVVIDQDNEERDVLGGAIWEVLKKTNFPDAEKAFFQETLTAQDRNMKRVVEMGTHLHLSQDDRWKNKDTKEDLLIWYKQWASWMLDGEKDPESYAEMLLAELKHAQTRKDSIESWTTAGGYTVNPREKAKAEKTVEEQGERPRCNYYRNLGMYDTSAMNTLGIKFIMKDGQKEYVVVVPPFAAINVQNGVHISKPTCTILKTGVVVTHEMFKKKGGVWMQCLMTPKNFWKWLKLNKKIDRELFMKAIFKTTKGQIELRERTVAEGPDKSVLIRVNFDEKLQVEERASNKEGCGSIYYDKRVKTYKLAVSLTEASAGIRLTPKVNNTEIRVYSLSEQEVTDLENAVKVYDVEKINKILIDDKAEVPKSDDGEEAGVTPVDKRRVPAKIMARFSGYQTRQRVLEQAKAVADARSSAMIKQLRVFDDDYVPSEGEHDSSVSSSASESDGGDSDEADQVNAGNVLGVPIIREDENHIGDVRESVQERTAVEESMEDVSNAVCAGDGLVEWCKGLQITPYEMVKCALCMQTPWRIDDDKGRWDKVKTCQLVWSSNALEDKQRRMYMKEYVPVPNSNVFFYGCGCKPTLKFICGGCADMSFVSLNEDVQNKIQTLTEGWAGDILKKLPGKFGACHSGCNGAYANIYKEISKDMYKKDLEEHQKMTLKWCKEARELRKALRNSNSQTVLQAGQDLQRMEAIQQAAETSAGDPAEASDVSGKGKECVGY